MDTVRQRFVSLVFLCACFVVTACGAGNTQAPTPTVAPAPVAAIAPTNTPVATAVPTRPAPTSTAIPTATPLPAPTAVPAQLSVTVTAGSAVNLRSGPDTEAVILTTLQPGNEATVIDEDVPSDFDDSHWVHVAYKSADGYIRNDLVSEPHAVLAQAPVSVATATPVPASAPVVPPTATATRQPVIAAAPAAPASSSSGSSSGGCVSNCTVSVRGYTRSNGTYVQPYVRSPPGTRSHK